MARTPEPPSPLVTAAQDLENELRHCEKTVEDAAKLRLNSEKNIGRAAHALQAASEIRESMAGKVNALLAAITASHARMQEAAVRMEARAVEIQARLTRLAAVQASAADIAGSMREVTEFARASKDARQILERLAPVEARVGKAFEEARAEEFEDVARDIAGMRDMLGALRRKLQALPPAAGTGG